MANIVLGLAGEMASGKGTMAEYVKKTYHAESFRFSTIFRDVLDRLYIAQTRENLQKLSTTLRSSFGDDLLASVITEDVKKSIADIVIIDGVRREEDIIFLKKIPSFQLVYIDADMRTRYNRIILRNENIDDHNKTFEKFVEQNKNEAESHILSLKSCADIIIDNSGTVEQLYEKIDKIIKC